MGRFKGGKRLLLMLSVGCSGFCGLFFEEGKGHFGMISAAWMA